MKSRTTLSIAVVVTAGIALLDAQATRPLGSPVRSPTQPVQGVGVKPPPMMAPRWPACESGAVQGLKYRLVGPSRGGRVTAVTGVPSQPRTFYMGVASGGVFRTTDGGATWVPITDGKMPVGSIGAIAVADSDPNIIYRRHRLGRRAQQRLDRPRRLQVDRRRRDVDSSPASTTPARSARSASIPTNPDIVWVVGRRATSSSRTPSAASSRPPTAARRGRRRCSSATRVGAMDVELQPGNPNVVYAWMSRLERKPWTIISGAQGRRLLQEHRRRRDASRRSRPACRSELIGKGNLAVTAAKPDRIYALIEAKPGGGFYRSDDCGQTWTALPTRRPR